MKTVYDLRRFWTSLVSRSFNGHEHGHEFLLQFYIELIGHRRCMWDMWGKNRMPRPHGHKS